jgi:hypothetical protein
MPRKRAVAVRTAQAWIESITEDPEATSALEVARAHVSSARALQGLRRMRLVELEGPLPAPAELARLLHRSIQFYNPHKERCHVRTAVGDPTPLGADERAVLVWERGAERRESAERWWRHETGEAVEVREGVAWAMSFDLPRGDVQAAVEALTVLRDREHGLLCNPHAQEHRVAAAEIPLPWLVAPRSGR